MNNIKSNLKLNFNYENVKTIKLFFISIYFLTVYLFIYFPEMEL